MSTTVTIDKLDLKEHVRYAQDQKLLDPVYITESGLVHAHSEITGTSSIYSSQWEILFETQVRNIPWALFSPPNHYRAQARRFFGSYILPTIYWDADHNEDQEESEKKNPYLERIYAAIEKEREADTLRDLDVKESNALCNLFESIGFLNTLLAQVNAKKLQYQKG
jgi:hypothetical protein